MKNKYLSIKSLMLITLMTLFSTQSLFAQLPNGSIAPDFTLTDLDGITHNLYADYLDQGYTVFLDFSAVWCPPCWSYHTSGALEDLYENHGPLGHPNVNASSTNDVMVFLIEADGSSEECIGGTGCGTHGDWITGTTFPIICTDGTVNNNAVSTAYDVPYFPAVYQVCPDRILTLCGTSASPYSLVTSCLPPPSLNNDARSFMNSSSSSGCSSIEPVITIQNYGLNNLTEVTIDVSVNGTLEYSTILDEIYDPNINMNVSLDLSTLDMVDVLLTPVSDLVNGDVITIDVNTPNATIDSDPLNNQVISFAVDLGYDNAYWDGQLSIDVAGDANNSWYLTKVSLNNASSAIPQGIEIAKGFGGVIGATNDLADLEFNECYTLRSVNGANLAYTVTDAMGNVILDGSASSVDDFDNFTTGNELWTSVENYDVNSFNVFPVPAKDLLYVDGRYDHLRVFDLLGKEVLYSTYTNSINVATLNNGLYILEITSSNIKFKRKIQISK
tara:strand:- start:303 stop:1802 length:1500 start_codon:yes stop_codon:yes gene_type:complete